MNKEYAMFMAMAQSYQSITSRGYRGSDVKPVNASRKKKHKRKIAQASRRANR